MISQKPCRLRNPLSSWCPFCLRVTEVAWHRQHLRNVPAVQGSFGDVLPYCLSHKTTFTGHLSRPPSPPICLTYHPPACGLAALYFPPTFPASQPPPPDAPPTAPSIFWNTTTQPTPVSAPPLPSTCCPPPDSTWPAHLPSPPLPRIPVAFCCRGGWGTRGWCGI